MAKKRKMIRVRRVGAKRRRVAIKRAPKKGGTRKRAGRGKMYGAKRPMRIQRATAVPKTVLITFVTDKTFHYTPPALPGGSLDMPTGILQVSCNNIIAPMLADNGTWASQHGTASDSVEGLGYWLANTPGGGGRYQTYAVLGAKLEVSSVATEVSGTAPTYCNNYSVGIHKNTNGLSDITATTNLQQAAKMPYTRIRNATGAVNVSGSNVIQGTRLSDTYSAKKWEGVTDVKDCAELHSTAAGDPRAAIAPAKGGKWQIFVASREPKSNTKQVPDQLIRVQATYTVLMRDPLTSNNDPMRE